ncbi:MAG: carboxypeptidase regulatory-like domain-containing protein [Candidatus Cloacimonetes bacterium]|jgi:hypothetical protein|nr:carboxypeptidase regulatory-like domain-containing protein [Candidatus Cloacimonadota bacterium]MDY0171552.1 carboxypeptidase regulatory-like domain-containing protein [Candidatus Cloacimonadaceae bacterium]
MKRMILFAMLLALTLGAFPSLSAQVTVTIGEGTQSNTDTGAPAPYGTWYRAFRQQLLYKADDFYAAGAGPGLISALAFNVQSLGDCSPMTNYTIRLKHTEQEALNSTFEAGEYTTVWQSDSFMPSTAWNQHNFAVPFLWDGASNLLVDISTDAAPATYTANARVYYTSTSYNSSLRFQSDSAHGSTGTIGGTATNRSNIRFIMSALSADPLLIVSPAAKDFGDVVLGHSLSQAFRMRNAGGGILTVNSMSVSGSEYFSLIDPPALPQGIAAGEHTVFQVAYTPTAPGEHTATVTITDNLRATHTVGLSGHGVDATIYELNYAQGFDEVAIPDLPLGWGHICESAGTSAYVKTVINSPHSEPNCVAMQSSADINAVVMLVAPPLATAIPANTLRVKLWGKGNGYSLKVGIMTNPADAATFTELQALTFNSNWTQYQVSFANYTGAGKFIAFKHANNSSGQLVYLDSIELEMMGANDLAGIALIGNSIPSVGATTQYTVSVLNSGAAPQSSYTVKLYDGNNVEFASTAGTASIAPGIALDVPVSWIPATEGLMSIYGKVILAGDINPENDASSPISISVQAAGLMSSTIGDGGGTARVPLDFSFKSSIYQNIFFPAEIGMVGTIHTISLYNQFLSANLIDKPVKIWMGMTDRQNLGEGWIPSTAMNLVFDGTMDFPDGANIITFPLQLPFAYTGGNLVVMFNRPLDGQRYSASDYFETQTGVTGRAREIHSDSSNYDPANLTGGSLTGVFPKTSLALAPLIGDPVFSMNPGAHDFGEVSLGSSRSHNFSVMNIGGGTLDINSINIGGNGTMTLSNLPTLPAALNTGETATFTVIYTPNSLGEDTATVTIAGNRETHAAELRGTCASNITIGSGAQTSRIPIDFYYQTSLFETIYLANELNNFSGTITGLKLYNQFASNLLSKPIKIWLGSTTQTSLENGWIPSTELTPVFDGTVNFPSGENTISINFPEPYSYLDGGNLVLMINRPLDAHYYSANDVFKCQTRGGNRSRINQNNSTDYDPTAPTGGIVSGQFPKTTFTVIPANAGQITGTVLGAGGSPLANVAVQANVDIRHQAVVTDAQGHFAIPNILPDNYAIVFSRHGYVDQTISIILAAGETEVMDVIMNPMAQVSITGTIVPNDTAIGIAGARIKLAGYEEYSATSIGNGSFTFPAIYANQSYAYTVFAAGYASSSGMIDLGAADYNMGNITLFEIAYAPRGVHAALNEGLYSVELNWDAPDPNAIAVIESFEGVFFPPEAWSQVISNAGPANTLGILPTWCSFGSVNISGTGNVVPPEGIKQVGLRWDHNHQDEWLIAPSFNCPLDAHMSFDTYAHFGSVNGDHYYVKVSSDGGNSWSILWDASAQVAGENHYEYPVTIDLAAYAGMDIDLAFQAEDSPSNEGLWHEWLIDNIYVGSPRESIRVVRSETERYNITGIEHSGLSLPTSSTNRALLGYKAWRLVVGQENNEDSWTPLSGDTISTLNHVDNDWTSLPNGTYKWAVKALYAADVMSAPAFSNSLVKIVANGTIVGFVRRQQNNQAIAGATVTVEGGSTATTNNAGAFSLNVPAGIYSVSASAPGFGTLTQENIAVAPNQNTTVNFIMIPVSNEDEIVPITVTALRGNYPNPFNPETTISYDLKDASDVRLAVYNVKGQLVRNLITQDQAAGRYRIVFNGRDDNGNVLSSGIYLYRFTAGKYSRTRKMMLME